MILAVVGPTASGKSDFALDLAQAYADRLQKDAPDAVEAINVDAMQFYRGMDIGTAKLPFDERRGIVHHQLDVLDVRDEASVARYQQSAREDMAAIEGRGRLPLVVGGSGLYIRALLDDMRFPPTNLEVRGRLERRLEEIGSDALHRELVAADPKASESIDPKNGRRIVRALEVISITGEAYSATLPGREYVEPTLQVAITRDLAELDQRIDQRTRLMFEQGLVEEVRVLRERGLDQGKTARRATGYAQVLAMLDGQMTQQEAVESIATATKQLARKQMKWFRPDPRIMWVDGTDSKAIAAVLNQLESCAR